MWHRLYATVPPTSLLLSWQQYEREVWLTRYLTVDLLRLVQTISFGPRKPIYYKQSCDKRHKSFFHSLSIRLLVSVVTFPFLLTNNVLLDLPTKTLVADKRNVTLTVPRGRNKHLAWGCCMWHHNGLIFFSMFFLFVCFFQKSTKQEVQFVG